MPSVREQLDRIERTCQADHTAKVLREKLLADIRAIVPFDGHVFALTDPVSRVATSPLADVPGLPWPRLPDLIRWRYLTRINRWSDLLDEGRGASSLLGSTAGDPSQSLLWRNVLRDLGVVDTAALAFGDRYGCWGFLDLWRTSSGAFTPGELSFLSALSGSVSAGLRRALARTFVDPDRRLSPIGPAIVILGPDLQVRVQTAGAAEALLRLNPPDEPMPPIPAAAYNIGAALIAVENGVGVGPAWSRVCLGGSRWVTVKADRIGGGDIAVSIEPSTAAERMDLFGRAHALSTRESEVLVLLGAGMDSREMAAELVISEHTVNDHVKAMLAKAGARTRQVLLSRALGS
ncbi:helix-turn-helix transcriptional regulator [Antrihabitans stalactiti]|uniref:Helix-turn-helix transcriptional regulator n=1 Tax=Antrihabitans stalactiti TaxID=2584121 RepID=A0A848KP15_9NOCA|nr:helix-turn-helix transcriptional regulator [Antrihabitans stalactiti]NMN97397.1 helix-turn-helix transcriptional regulator [Antrihabitans stalactiti]